MGILLALILNTAPCPMHGYDALCLVGGEITSIEATEDAVNGDVYTVTFDGDQLVLGEYVGYLY